MTKAILIGAIILILVLLLVILAQWFISNSTEQISTSLKAMSAAMDEGDWLTAREHYGFARERWDKDARVFRVIVDQAEIRDIELSFIDMGYMLGQERLLEAGKELENLFFYLQHVRDDERVKLENIL